ncbi:hypothetical protein PESP_a0730 [Pseudoalteromonas espejiana DSM 9414]|uniref:YcxB-like protein domain-containing protein n=1 Tax=Pseudoalteromonas espejiana TaxID=28107 RepID=A0A510Y0C7_9GAMM|nr:YcxB family protein [Pseudoalteromonas espejiana]ASM48944.1 hypothetical protein PESP_a0730 [Pseudoalteromonas espejiana DSM 9414]GEK56785.1 hypothetical protein PES01_36300 [Pseudoalteromonas espejiana]
MSLTTTYKLDKPYYYECFDESLPYSKGAKPKYFLLLLLVCLGLFSIYAMDDHYLGTFLIMVGVLECVAFYYRRPWWVTRQMFSRASGSQVTLEFTDEAISSSNHYKNHTLTWSEITAITKTPRGYLIHHKHGMQYISSSVLTDDMLDFINKKATQ